MLSHNKKKNDPIVNYPSYLDDQKIFGDIIGRQIENTNQYNIISSKVSSNYGDKIYKIGEIVDAKPKSFQNILTGVRSNGKLDFYDIDGNLCMKEPYQLKIDIFSRNTGIIESDVMLDSGVIISGCGSVGSLFALEMARSGVGKFMLVDNDIISYHNICRHQCGILDVGKYKVDAVRERILEINPEAEDVTFAGLLQSVPKKMFDGFCDENTMIVGCADNRDGDLYANKIANIYNIPMMSVGFWERAFAGEVFYCLPNEMPDYEDFYKSIGESSGRVNQNRIFYTNEADLEKTFFEPGISVDINFVTTVAIKLAIDILNRKNKKYHPKLINHLTQYTLICNTNDEELGGELAYLFSYPLQVTTSIEVPYADK